MRSLPLYAALLAVLLAACIPANGNMSVRAVPESEPNETSSQATSLGGPGTYTYFGTCDVSDLADWFKADSSGGGVEASLYASGSPMGAALTAATAALPTVALHDQTLAVLDHVDQVTAEAALSGQLTGAQTVYLEISCPQTGRVYYWGTLRIP